jgi:ubiquinone/menaquinone biosynthesis C-methylase UbiE
MSSSEAASRRAPDFGPLAESYDRLRPVDDNWRELFELLATVGDFTGRRVLDVGCGTGQLAAALVERGARVWGVDPTPEMLALARRAAPRAGFKQGSAEALPFKDDWFERVVFRLVLHLADPAHAFAEAQRVLAPGGRVVAVTFAPEHFERYWLNELFPAVLAIDRARFPPVDELVRKLEEAGFGGVQAHALTQRAELAREEALLRVRGKHISTLYLLDEADYAAGLARAERELPEIVETTAEWVVLVATLDSVRPGS